MVTSTQVMQLASGLTETVVVSSSVVSSDPIEGRIQSLANFRDAGNPALINGTPQTYTLDLAQIPSGEYLIKVRVDDMVHPIITKSPTATLVVSHTWPANWFANLQVADNRFRETVLSWTPMELLIPTNCANSQSVLHYPQQKMVLSKYGTRIHLPK